MVNDFIKFSKSLQIPESISKKGLGDQPIGNLVPIVVEQTSRGERAFDIFSRLLKDRIIIIGTPINDVVANLSIAQILYLTNEDPERDINIYINSPGGMVYSGLGVYDTIQYVSCPVATICVGLAASLGSVLLAAGAKAHRAALPNSRIMLHQPLGVKQKTAYEIEIQAREILWLKQRLYEILAQHTGQDTDTIAKDADRDYWLSSQEAKDYGLIDNVLEQQALPTKKK